MSRMKAAFRQLAQSRGIVLAQLVIHPLLLALYAGWLLIPVSRAMYLVLMAVVALLGLAIILTLHGATMAGLASPPSPVRSTLRAFMRNALAWVAWLVVALLLWWWLAGALALDNTESWAAYLRSRLSAESRAAAGQFTWDRTFAWAATALLYWLVPALLLPFGVHTAARGARAAWRPALQTLRAPSWWIATLVLSQVAVMVAWQLVWWRFGGSLAAQTFSMVVRFAFAYLVILIAYLWSLSLAGVLGSDLGRQTGTKPAE